MIMYALTCPGEHAFDAWFSDSASFDKQNARDLVECPHCGSRDIRKQIMAPAVISGRAREERHEPKGNSDASPQLSRLAARIRRHIDQNYDHVGADFVETAIAMHNGEIDERPVWGETTPEQAMELCERGVPTMPLPDRFAPIRGPGKTN